MPKKAPKPRKSRKAERRKLRPTIIDPHQFYSIEEAGAALDKSRMQMFNDINAGLIKTLKDRARTKISGAELIRFSQALVRAADRRAAEAQSDSTSAA